MWLVTLLLTHENPAHDTGDLLITGKGKNVHM